MKWNGAGVQDCQDDGVLMCRSMWGYEMLGYKIRKGGCCSAWMLGCWGSDGVLEPCGVLR